MQQGRGKKVVVAMSGGVDSSVAAAMLKEAGYEVVGCFMRLGGDSAGHEPPGDAAPGAACATTPGRAGHQGCCSVSDAADARLVAAMLDIPLYVLNFKADFARVIDYFVAEYNAGRTPNPCIRCNDWLKFGKLAAYARSIDADFIASGHYARVEHGEVQSPKSKVQGQEWGGDAKPQATEEAESSTLDLGPWTLDKSFPRLLRGVDRRKDQSYVLFGVGREMLGHMLLPIGGMTKPEVRELAERYKLPVFDKPDSQEICFVPDNDYAKLLGRRTPERLAAGDLVDEEGRVLGRHEGQQHFTIGQRRGTGVSRGVPLYVLDRDARTNQVMLGPRESLLSGGLIADQTNWLIDPPREQAVTCEIKIRYNGPTVAGKVQAQGDDGLRIDFDQPQAAVTPGQAVVCYRGDHLLGGGWIREAVKIGNRN